MDRRKLGEVAEYLLSALLLIVILLNVVSTFMPYVSATHATQLWFGYQGITSAYVWDGGDDLIGDEHTTPGVNVTAQSISVWLLCANAHSVKCAIYINSTLAFVEETEERSITSAGGEWFTFNFATGVPLNASTIYTLCVWANDGTGTISTNYGGGGDTQRDAENYNGFPSTFSEDVNMGWNTAIYCSYTVEYTYSFHGLYDENTGLRAGAIDVVAHFAEIGYEEFTVDGTYNFYHDTQPLYFSYNLTESIAREYWLDNTGENGIAIYLFNSTAPQFTVYTIQFYDLAGILDGESIIQVERMVNATTYTVEKRRVDVQDKILASLVNGELYTLTVVDASDGTTYIYGSLRMTAVTQVSLTLKGIEFPKETLLTYSNVRIYGDRAHDSPTGNITLYYEDTLEETLDVALDIDFINGTDVFYNSGAMQSFVYEYTSADNASSYMVTITVNHSRYGVFAWRQTFPREAFDTAPFGLSFLGSLPFATSYLLPGLIIFLTAACFTVLSVEAGAFMTVVVAAALAFMGWLPIPGATLIIAFALAILLGIVLAKRRLIVG